MIFLTEWKPLSEKWSKALILLLKGRGQPTFRTFETPWGQGYYYTNISYGPLTDVGVPQSSFEQPLSVGERIKQLEQELQILVAKEDYENAVKVRDCLKDLKENYHTYEERLKELQEKKRIAVQSQDFESAAKYKKEIEDLAATSNLQLE